MKFIYSIFLQICKLWLLLFKKQQVTQTCVSQWFNFCCNAQPQVRFYHKSHKTISLSNGEALDVCLSLVKRRVCLVLQQLSDFCVCLSTHILIFFVSFLISRCISITLFSLCTNVFISLWLTGSWWHWGWWEIKMKLNHLSGRTQSRCLMSKQSQPNRELLSSPL